MELRSNPRYPIQCPIAFSGDDNTIGEGTVVNLSTGGWRVRSATQPRPGTYLALHVLLPDEAPPMEVDLAAVRWAWGSEFGLEFIRMRSEEQERLHRFVKTLEAQPASTASKDFLLPPLPL